MPLEYLDMGAPFCIFILSKKHCGFSEIEDELHREIIFNVWNKFKGWDYQTRNNGLKLTENCKKNLQL